MGSFTRPRGLPLLVMISLPPVFVQILWSLFSTCSFIVLWLLVFFLGYSPLCFLLLLCAPRCCFVMLYLVSPRMSCWWFLRFFVTYLMFLSFIFGWLKMIFVFGASVLRLWMLWSVLSLVFGFIFLCFSVASVLLVVVISLFANGVLVVWWLPFGMMFSWSTFSLSLSCVFLVCPGLFSGVPLLWRWMSRLTGGLLICHSPLRWVMLVLLSSCPLCYLFVPFVLLCWGGVRFPGEFGVLVHPRLRRYRL